MKKIVLGVTLAAMTLVGGAASAQGYGGYYGRDGGSYSRDRGHDRREWNRDGRHDRRHYRYDRRSEYRGHGYWREGQVYPRYRQSGYYINDYRAYNLAAPRHGYRYYRTDNGDVVMAAIASGVIGAIIGNALSDNDRGGHRYYGR